MPVEKLSPSTGIIDVLDRVLDKGIVVDASVRVALVGVDLLAVDARLVVASIETYLKYSDALAATSLAARPHLPALTAVERNAVSAPARAIEPPPAIS